MLSGITSLTILYNLQFRYYNTHSSERKSQLLELQRFSQDHPFSKWFSTGIWYCHYDTTDDHWASQKSGILKPYASSLRSTLSTWNHRWVSKWNETLITALLQAFCQIHFFWRFLIYWPLLKINCKSLDKSQHIINGKNGNLAQVGFSLL